MTTEVNTTPAPVQSEDGLNIQTSDQYLSENAGVTIAEATRSEVLSPDMSEDEMHELAEIDRYYSEMSAGELLQETEFESHWGKLSALDVKLASFTPEETHLLAELMASMDASGSMMRDDPLPTRELDMESTSDLPSAGRLRRDQS